jgi:hypothetical protein
VIELASVLCLQDRTTDMPRVTLEHVFRYLFPGVTFLMCMLVAYPSSVPSLASGWTKVTVGSLIGGALFYTLYRTVLYDYLISPLLNLISKRIVRRPNYRTWLVDRYELTTTSAEEVYAGAIRPKFKELNTKSIRERSAQVHMLYQAAIIVLLFAGSLVLTEPLQLLLFWLLAAGIALFGTAILADIRLDRQVQATLQSGEATVDKILKKMKIERRKQA